MSIDQAKVFAIVPAAGASLRMGSGISKALLELAGISVIQRSINSLINSDFVDRLVVLTPPHQTEDFQAACHLNIKIDFLAGAEQRQGSVLKGLEFIAHNFDPKPFDLVLVHDAARCLVNFNLVKNVIKVAAAKGAATLACPAVDAVVKFDQVTKLLEYQDRSVLWQIQTPQVFRFDLLWQGHHSGQVNALDDAALVQPFKPVEIVLGSKLNFKITTKEDLSLAEAVLESAQFG